jgi:dihydroorotate dehydrogenase electron transfer subunit
LLKTLTAEIAAKSEITPDIFSLFLRAESPVGEIFPGQFAMVDCGKKFSLRRPLSVHYATNKSFSLLVKNAGKGTEQLNKLQVKDSLNLLLPLGNGFNINPASHKVLLVAGGIGIAPLYFLATEALKKGIGTTLLMGAATRKHLYPRQLLPEGLDFKPVTEDGSSGTKARVTDVIIDYLDDADQVFVCGPLNMYKTLTNIIKSSNFKNNIQVSLEVRMGCGFGVCNGCTIKTKNGLKKVCTDGPVFEFNEVDWESVNL